MPVFRVHNLVELQFNEARAWYAGRSPRAAENFALRFDATLEKIKTRPTAHAPWRSIFRRCRVAQFPYLVLFHADRRFASVLMLVHHRRAPETVLATNRKRLTHFV